MEHKAAIIPLYSPSEGSITYNGSNWSEIASTLTNRGNGVGIFGTQNNAVAVGGCAMQVLLEVVLKFGMVQVGHMEVP